MKANQIVKADSNLPYTIIPNEVLQDPNISARAKGLLCYILSLPSNWVIYKGELHKHFKEGRDAIANAFTELVDNGYILGTQLLQGEDGKFRGYNYIVYPVAQQKQPLTEKPITVKPITVNPQLQTKHSTKETNTNSNVESKDIYSLFLEMFNKTITLDAKRNFKGCAKSRRQFAARLKDGYEGKDFQLALKNIMLDKYHLDTDLRYVTPDFVTRSNILERFINIQTLKENKTGRKDGLDYNLYLQ
jgi:hypothetical protein